MNKNQKGFTVVEGLLIVLIVAVIGFGGYYVWNNQHKTKATVVPSNPNSSISNFDECKKSAGSITLQSSPEVCVTKDGKRFTHTTTQATNSQNFVTIKEWGVRAPYNGNLNLTYKIVGNSAGFTSTQLTTANAGCSAYGGSITRYAPNDAVLGYGTAASVYANPNGVTISHVGNYYYVFDHDQALCGAISSPSDPAAAIQSQTDDAVGSLVPKLEVIPAS